MTTQEDLDKIRQTEDLLGECLALNDISFDHGMMALMRMVCKCAMMSKMDSTELMRSVNILHATVVQEENK